MPYWMQVFRGMANGKEPVTLLQWKRSVLTYIGDDMGSVTWVLIMDSTRKGIKKHTGQASTDNNFHIQAQLRKGIFPDLMALPPS